MMNSPTARRILALLILSVAQWANATSTVLTVFTLSTKNNINFSVAGVDQKVASFLIANPAQGSFNVLLSFANDCNVQHYTMQNLDIPITKVRIAVNGGPIQDFWTRGGSDCTLLPIWTPPDPSPSPYAANYQIDVFISWNARPLIIAGKYSETLNINAYIP